MVFVPSTCRRALVWVGFLDVNDTAGVIAVLRAAGCVFAEDEARLLMESASSATELNSMVDRRVAGEPLEQIVGWAEFCGSRVTITPGVFVPRTRTELLVRTASGLCSRGDLVLDLCCGSGAVGLALAAAVPGIELYASDISDDAVRCASTNLGAVGAVVLVGDLFDAVPTTLRGRISLIVVNAPYVPSDQVQFMPPEARDHEPLFTLDGGSDGLDFHRRVAAEAPGWLISGGHLVIETSRHKAGETARLIEAGGSAAQIETDDEIGGTVVIGSYR